MKDNLTGWSKVFGGVRNWLRHVEFEFDMKRGFVVKGVLVKPDAPPTEKKILSKDGTPEKN